MYPRSIGICSDFVGETAVNAISLCLPLWSLSDYQTPFVQLTWLSIPAILPHWYPLDPVGLFTSMFSMVIFPQTVGLEHTKYPTSGSYFSLVVPLKLRIVTSDIVRLDGYWKSVSVKDDRLILQETDFLLGYRVWCSSVHSTAWFGWRSPRLKRPCRHMWCWTRHQSHLRLEDHRTSQMRFLATLWCAHRPKRLTCWCCRPSLR